MNTRTSPLEIRTAATHETYLACNLPGCEWVTLGDSETGQEAYKTHTRSSHAKPEEPYNFQVAAMFTTQLDWTFEDDTYVLWVTFGDLNGVTPPTRFGTVKQYKNGTWHGSTLNKLGFVGATPDGPARNVWEMAVEWSKSRDVNQGH